MEPDLLHAQRAAVVVLNLAIAILAGSSAAHLWLRAAASAWAAAVLPRLSTATRACAAVALAAYAAVLWFDAASMAEVPLASAYPAVVSALSATHYGLAWLVGAAALVAVGLAALAAPAGDAKGWGNAVRILGLGLFLYTRSMVSHAGAAGDFTWAVAADWIHLVLVCVWVGEVIVAGLVLLDREAPAERASREECARYIGRLSHSATIALTGIFITGAVSAWRGLGAIDNLAGNPYGTTLLVKVALVLCAAALGGLNRFLVMPGLLRALAKPPAPGAPAGRRFAAVLQLEAAVLVAVVVAAAFLSSTPPPSAH